MGLREQFEELHGVPLGCRWSEEKQEYVWCGPEQWTFLDHNDKWLSWISACEYCAKLCEQGGAAMAWSVAHQIRNGDPVQRTREQK